MQKYGIPKEQDCVTKIKNLLYSKSPNTLCYGAKCKTLWVKDAQIHAQNIARDFVPKHAPNLDFVLNVMLKIQTLCSKYRDAHLYYAQKEKCSYM